MPEGDIVAYNALKFELLNKVHDLGSGGDTLQITLHTAYSLNIDDHSLWGDAGVSSTEYGTADGYTAGGKVLASQSTTKDNSNDRSLFDANDVTWTALGALTPATPSHAIIWNNTPSTPLDPLIVNVLLGATATNGGDYTIAFSASPAAIFTIT